MTRSRYEDDLQVAVAQYLDLRGWLWTHFPAGEKRHPRVGAKLKRMGLKRGVPDCLIFEPVPKCVVQSTDYFKIRPGYYGLAIELKRPKQGTRRAGTMSKDQLEWRRRLADAGWLHVVCYSIGDVVKVCEKYLG